MEDVTAIKVTDSVRGKYAFLTWGRIYDAVDPAELVAAFKRLLPAMGFVDVKRVSVCYDLGEVSAYRYFFEGLLHFSAKMAVEPYRDEDWLRTLRDDEVLRKNIFLIGPSRRL